MHITAKFSFSCLIHFCWDLIKTWWFGSFYFFNRYL